MNNSPLIPNDKTTHDIIINDVNKPVFSMIFYLMLITTLITQSKVLFYGSIGITCLKIYKTYTLNKSRINKILNYVL